MTECAGCKYPGIRNHAPGCPARNGPEQAPVQEIAQCAYRGGDKWHILTDPVDVHITVSEYECPYDWEWGEMERPYGHRLQVPTRQVYRIPHDMYDRWAAARDGFWNMQGDINVLKGRKRNDIW